jgi:actin-related protein
VAAEPSRAEQVTARTDRERLVEFLFESMGALSVLPVSSCEACLFACGGPSHGLVVDMGHSGTDIVPVVDGLPMLPESRRILNISGQTMTTAFGADERFARLCRPFVAGGQGAVVTPPLL